MTHPTPSSVLLLLSSQPGTGRVYDTPPVLYSPAPWRASPWLAMVWARIRRAQTAPGTAARSVPGCAASPRLRRASAVAIDREPWATTRPNHGARFRRGQRSAGGGHK